MAEKIMSSAVPVPESLIRDLSKDLKGVVPKFSELEPANGVKDFHAIIGPLLDTADTADLSPSHRAGSYNILCAVIEKCQASDAQYAQEALLDDFIWARLLEIYLVRSDNAKGKSMRQVLLLLTGLLLKNANARSLELQERAATTFIDIICQRQDRLKVKPALQALAHFIQKGITTIPQLVKVYAKLLDRSTGSTEKTADLQSLFNAFLSWTVHHDTSLSAGHLIRNFLTQLRRSDKYADSENEKKGLPIWIQPVVQTLRFWPDRIQEFKTHVFPYCFLPNFEEYLRFLSYLRFERHVGFSGPIPQELKPVEFDISLEDLDEFRILLAAIETGKELGIVKDLDHRVCNSIEILEDAIHLPDAIFGGWLSHPEPEVRLAGLHLSIYSTAITKPITGGILNSLKRNMVHLHAETDANSRRELLSYIQKLFNRLRGCTSALAKIAKGVTTISERLPFPPQAYETAQSDRMCLVQDPLLESLRFIVWYMQFLQWELRSEASYQRRITAVRALTVVLRSGLDPRIPYHQLSKGAQGQLHWAHGLRIPNMTLMRSLLDFVIDPFDDVRESSVSLLQLCLESMPEDERTAAFVKVPGFIRRAEAAMLRTGRADQADGVARAYALLFASNTNEVVDDTVLRLSKGDSRLAVLSQLNEQLKDTLAVARSNLSEAVNGRPVHGTFAAIRYIIDQDQFYPDLASLSDDELPAWKRIHAEAVSSIEELWSCVIEALCADAPEGHVPEDLEEEASLDTKEVLSYSWRGLKEASILLRVIVTRAPIGSSDRSFLTPALFEKLGNLCFTQLVELRHRGAFSTVAQTFSVFCRRCVSSKDPVISALPEKWYTQTLATIKAKADTITRRSGGLPALMVGIVAAEPQPGGKLFARAMKDLVTEASVDAESSNIEESRLPQVHALNCIKEFFLTSKLSIASEAYMGEGLELAAKTLNSSIWPIRNCSLMLFKSLIERLLGSDEAQDWKEREGTRTSRFSFENYPTLIGILQSLLDTEGPLKESLNTPDSTSPMDLHGAEGVFPALQILRQASPPEEVRGAILKSVMNLFASPHWHLRDMAARTATILHQPSAYPLQIKSLLNSSVVSTNSQHGSLLCARYMLSRLLQDVSNLETQTLVDIMHNLEATVNKNMNNTCPFTRVTVLDLVSLCGTAIIKLPVQEPLSDSWNKVTAAISVGPEYDLDPSNQGSYALYQEALARIFFIDRLIIRPDFLDVLVCKRYQNLGDALKALENNDPDTCCAALETLDNIIQPKTPRGPLMQVSLILLHIYRLFQDAKDPEVLSKAQFVLADGLSRDGMVTSVLSLIREDDLLTTLDKLESQCLESAPSNMRGALHLLGFFLDWIYQKFPAHRLTVETKLARYIRLIRMTLIDTNPFDDRFAAVQFVSALDHIWKIAPASGSGSLLLGLAFVLYDMLNDDDDEIRDNASIVTARLLQAHSPTPNLIKPVAPILASHCLAKFLITTFSNSSNLYKEATRRLIGTPSRTPLFNTSFFAVFTQTRKEDTALFATEKQNLYKDDTLDAALWCRVLFSLPPHAAPSSLRSGLDHWVSEALQILVSTAKSDTDGALGWTAKPEMFNLGMRVLYAAALVMKWAPISKETSKVRTQLVEFIGAAGKSEVHGLWVEKAEKLLEESILGLLKSVGDRVGKVENALNG